MPDFARRTIFGGTVNVGITTAAYCAELLNALAGNAAAPGARLEYKGIRQPGPVPGDDERAGGSTAR